jgi:hypothetical protein
MRGPGNCLCTVSALDLALTIKRRQQTVSNPGYELVSDAVLFEVCPLNDTPRVNC